MSCWQVIFGVCDFNTVQFRVLKQQMYSKSRKKKETGLYISILGYKANKEGVACFGCYTSLSTGQIVALNSWIIKLKVFHSLKGTWCGSHSWFTSSLAGTHRPPEEGLRETSANSHCDWKTVSFHLLQMFPEEKMQLIGHLLLASGSSQQREEMHSLGAAEPLFQPLQPFLSLPI